jgi:hypothetical protein
MRSETVVDDNCSDVGTGGGGGSVPPSSPPPPQLTVLTHSIPISPHVDRRI